MSSAFSSDFKVERLDDVARQAGQAFAFEDQDEEIAAPQEQQVSWRWRLMAMTLAVTVFGAAVFTIR